MKLIKMNLTRYILQLW